MRLLHGLFLAIFGDGGLRDCSGGVRSGFFSALGVAILWNLLGCLACALGKLVLTPTLRPICEYFTWRPG